MMSELDNLTNAWEQLDARVGSKVFDLAEVEDKLIKLTSEVCLQMSILCSYR